MQLQSGFHQNTIVHSNYTILKPINRFKLGEKKQAEICIPYATDCSMIKYTIQSENNSRKECSKGKSGIGCWQQPLTQATI